MLNNIDLFSVPTNVRFPRVVLRGWDDSTLVNIDEMYPDGYSVRPGKLRGRITCRRMFDSSEPAVGFSWITGCVAVNFKNAII